MSATNGTNGVHNRLDPEDYLSGRKGANYRPYALGGGLYSSGVFDGRPLYTWSQAESMRRDPQIDFGLRILRSPLWRVKWQVKAKRTEIAQFVDAMLRRIWTRALRKIARSFHVYGVHPGEFTFATEGGLIVFAQLDDFHPRDTRPLEFKRGADRGKLAGVQVRNVAPADAGSGSIGGMADITAPHAWWFAGDAEYGLHYGRPRLAGAFEPWLEKRGRNGAIDARRLGMRKAIYSGPRLRFPPGRVDYGPEDGSAPNYVSHQDIARQIGEMLENGSTTALPNIPHSSDKMAGKYAWELEEPKPLGEMPQLLEYPEHLDKEILRGLGIPPEIVDAATVGSGYSGRCIPALVFFTSMDEDASLLIDAIDLQCIRGLVALNFGKAAYEITPESLAEAVEKDPAKAADMLRGDGEDQKEEPQPTQLSHGDDKRERLAERIRTLAERDFADIGPIQLSWGAEKTSRGTIKAVGSGEHSGKVLYGDAARKALAAKPEGSAKPTAAKKGERPTVETTVAHVAKLRENFTIEGLGHLAHVLQQHTVAEMGQIKAALGIKASGSKVELAKKIAQRALAEPEKGTEAEKPKEPRQKALNGNTYTGPHDKEAVDRINHAWRMAGASSMPNSELNAAMIELAKADSGTWLAATKAMGFGHLPDAPKNRRDLSRFMFDARGQSMRNAIADKDDIEAGETTNRKAMAGWQRSNDEPLLQADEVMAKAKTKGKPAANLAATKPTSFGTAGDAHSLAGIKDRAAQVKKLGDIFNRARNEEEDPSNVGGGPPDGLDMKAFGADLKGTIARHAAAVGVGAGVKEAYEATAKKYRLSKHDFQRALVSLHDEGVIRLSGWPMGVDDFPDPELAFVNPGTTGGFVGYINPTGSIEKDAKAGDQSLNTSHPEVQKRHGDTKPAAESPHAAAGKSLGESLAGMKDGTEADALGKQLERDMSKLTPEQAREYMRAAGFAPSKTETKPSIVRKLKGHIDAVARSRAQTSNIG